MVDKTEHTDLVKFNSVSMCRAPVGDWGLSPQKLNVFSFSEGDCCNKTGGGGHHQSKILEVGWGWGGGVHGVMLVCVNVISGAPEEEYQILSKFNILFVRTNVSS